MKILLIDDEEEFVSTLAERLIIRGLEADWVNSGLDALAKAEETDYDLMVVDIKMPGMSGPEFIRRISEKKPAVKFIVLSGHGDVKSLSDNDPVAICHRLVKPIDIDVLLDIIQQMRCQ
ncbi:MAG: response regulator [Deltaproteobacteria bacterium]|nr:response regulator [Deltaproteobacteria bacterium]